MRVDLSYLIAILIIIGNAITWAQVARKDFSSTAEEERDKRAIDFGLFVRNLLLKSAAASNVKSNISRNVANLKSTIPAPKRRATTTTTLAPFFFNKGPFKFPFDLSAPINNNKFNLNNKFNNGGYINFDYNDNGAKLPVRPGRRQKPTSTTTTSTTISTTTGAPTQPTKRRPIPRRPYGLFGKQKIPHFDYYNVDDDYNYNYDDNDDDIETNDTASTTADPPAASPSPPSSPPARPQRPPTANRARAQGRVPQLRNRFVYQFRQPEDISTNNPTPPVDDSNSANDDNDDSQPNDGNFSSNNNDKTSANTNDYIDANNGNDTNIHADDTNNTANNEQDYLDSSNNTNSNGNNNDNNEPPPNDSNLNLASYPYQGQAYFDAREDFVGPNAHTQFNLNSPSFANFVPSKGFQYPFFNDLRTQYQPSSAAGYSVSYY